MVFPPPQGARAWAPGLGSATWMLLTKALTFEGATRRFRRLGTFAAALSPSRCICIGRLEGGQGRGAIRSV